MQQQLSYADQQHISDYLGIDLSELCDCPVTLEPVKSPGDLVFEYRMVFSTVVPSSAWAVIEDGNIVRVPAWVIEG